jgi:hypothetical protein
VKSGGKAIVGANIEPERRALAGHRRAGRFGQLCVGKKCRRAGDELAATHQHAPGPEGRAARKSINLPAKLAIKTLRNRCIAIPEAVENAGYRYILTVEQAGLVGGLVGGLLSIYTLGLRLLSG